MLCNAWLNCLLLNFEYAVMKDNNLCTVLAFAPAANNSWHIYMLCNALACLLPVATNCWPICFVVLTAALDLCNVLATLLSAAADGLSGYIFS